MGTRDYSWREPKKPKKGAKRATKPEIMPTSAAVEVIKKGKRAKEQA